ncbi:MAG: preprotein translocase subunit SecE [Clostridiales bacterium]|nr:MAG: preprotein translocase subunit SecE [Clostridiales bacterium]
MADEKKLAESSDSKKSVKVKKDKKPNVFKKIGRFFKELKSEITKVVWPSPSQVVNNTITVLVIALICSIFIGIIDWLFKTGVSLLMKIGQ